MLGHCTYVFGKPIEGQHFSKFVILLNMNSYKQMDPKKLLALDKVSIIMFNKLDHHE